MRPLAWMTAALVIELLGLPARGVGQAPLKLKIAKDAGAADEAPPAVDKRAAKLLAAGGADPAVPEPKVKYAQRVVESLAVKNPEPPVPPTGKSSVVQNADRLAPAIDG